MPKNTYTAQFKADAVKLYESHPDLGYTRAAADLGIARGSLQSWVRNDRHDTDTIRGHPRRAAAMYSLATIGVW